jgi:hypothetical protein
VALASDYPDQLSARLEGSMRQIDFAYSHMQNWEIYLKSIPVNGNVNQCRRIDGTDTDTVYVSHFPEIDVPIFCPFIIHYSHCFPS